MPLDLNKADKQMEPIPAGQYRLRITLKTKAVGVDQFGVDLKLQRSKADPLSLLLSLECTVVEGEHRGRKVFDYPAVDISEQDILTPLKQDARDKLESNKKRGLTRLRAIVDSACGLDPNDMSKEAVAIRDRFNTYRVF